MLIVSRRKIKIKKIPHYHLKELKGVVFFPLNFSIFFSLQNLRYGGCRLNEEFSQDNGFTVDQRFGRNWN